MNTWVKIDKKLLLENIRTIYKNISEDKDIFVVLKANAYGHGLKEIVSIIKDQKVSFAVYSVKDALYIRKYTKREVLVMQVILKKEINLCVKNNISITVADKEMLNYAASICDIKNKIHIKFDTGLGRQGFLPEQTKEVIDICKLYPKQKFGLYSHMSDADSLPVSAYTKKQLSVFKDIYSKFIKNNIKVYCHLGASSGIFNKDLQFDAVRVGISLYGLYPSESIRKKYSDSIRLCSVLSWYSKIVQIKTLSKGMSVGYDHTYRAIKDTKVAIVPVGYYDGLFRSASNKGWMLVNGEKANIIGRVMMNICILDITNCGVVSVGDTATILGKNSLVSAEEIAKFSGTINYDIVTRINQEIKRLVV